MLLNAVLAIKFTIARSKIIFMISDATRNVLASLHFILLHMMGERTHSPPSVKCFRSHRHYSVNATLRREVEDSILLVVMAVSLF